MDYMQRNCSEQWTHVNTQTGKWAKRFPTSMGWQNTDTGLDRRTQLINSVIVTHQPHSST